MDKIRDFKSWVQNEIIKIQRSGVAFKEIDLPDKPDYPSRFGFIERVRELKDNIDVKDEQHTAVQNSANDGLKQLADIEMDSAILDVFESFGKAEKPAKQVAQKKEKTAKEPEQIDIEEAVKEASQNSVRETDADELVAQAPQQVDAAQASDTTAAPLTLKQAFAQAFYERSVARNERKAMRLDYKLSVKAVTKRDVVDKLCALAKIEGLESVLECVEFTLLDQNDNTAIFGGSTSKPVPMYKE